MAALVGANLAEFLQNALTKKFPATQVTLGSESQIGIRAISKYSNSYAIKRLFPPTSWQYCLTSDNLAALLTRGVSDHCTTTDLSCVDAQS